MNSALYVPNVTDIVDLFKPKPSTAPKVNKTSSIELTSPVDSVVERAKSELKRINMHTTTKPIIASNNFEEAKPIHSSNNKSVSKIKIKRLCKKKTRKKNHVLLQNKENKRHTNSPSVTKTKKPLQLSNKTSFRDIFG